MIDNLSLCMIVKNEENALRDCLESVKDVVGEIVILDTGSTDGTVAIAEEFGATIGHYEWNQDFAAARNEAIKLVTKDWVLVLDADELLNPKAVDGIKEAIAEPDTLVVNLIRYEIGAVQSPYSLVSRLFRRHPKLQFERPYHAMIDDSAAAILAEEPQWQVKDLNTVALFHTGYQQAAITKLEKSTRAKNAMERYFADHKNDPYVCSKLGAIYVAEGLAKQGLKVLKQGLKCSANASPNLIYELHYHLANAFRKQDEPEKAVKHYQKAIEQPILNKLKIGAHHNLGALFQTLGKAEEAIAQHQTTVIIDPKFASGHYHLGKAFKAAGKIGEAIAAYEQSLKYNPYNPWVHQSLGAILFGIGQIQESTKFFKQAIMIHEETNPQEAERLRSKLNDMLGQPL